jgi:hypothetical protein
MPSKALRVSGVSAVLYTPAKYETVTDLPVIFDETTGTAWKRPEELTNDNTLSLTIEEFLRQRTRPEEPKPTLKPPSAAPTAQQQRDAMKAKEPEPEGPPKPKFPLIVYVTRSDEIADAFPRTYSRAGGSPSESHVKRGLLHLVADQSHYYILHPEVRRAAYLFASNCVILAVAYEDLVARDAEEDARFRASPPTRRKPLRAALNIVLDSILKYLKKDDRIDEERIILCSGPTGKSCWQTVWLASIQEPNRLAGVVPITGSAASSDEDEEDHRGFIYWDRTVQLTSPELEHISVFVVSIDLPSEEHETQEFDDSMPGMFSISSLAMKHAISSQMVSSLKAAGSQKVVESKVPVPKTVKEKYQEIGNPYASVDLAKGLLASRKRKKTVVKL